MSMETIGVQRRNIVMLELWVALREMAGFVTSEKDNAHNTA